MRCPSCDHDNRADRRFCTECGATLSVAGPSCGAPTEPGEKFCGGCGARLTVICTACTARLWRGQGKRAAARELVDAKALLDDLA